MSPRAPLTVLLTAALTFAAGAQDAPRLPDLGSSAGALISPQEAARYGASMLHQMRSMHMVLDDPLLNDYLNGVGYRLVAASTDRKQKFTFFIVRDNDINAFAAPGGYIGVNAGLIDIAHSESELAAVMAHEIGHIAQHHLERAFESSKKDAPLMALVMLGAIAVGAGGGRNSGDATMGVLASGMGLLQQRKIKFTRKDEAEADRVGIQTLARAGYDPMAMADFFQRMANTLSVNGGDDVPELLRTHPVTTRRIADAKARARVLEEQDRAAAAVRIDPAQWRQSTAPIPFVKDPEGLLAAGPDHDPNRFLMMRERVRVLAGDPTQLVGYYQKNLSTRKRFDTLSNRYGYALALTRSGRAAEALKQLRPLVAAHPDNLPLQLAMADAQVQGGQRAAALKRYADLEADSPNNRAIALAYAHALLYADDKADARQAAGLLKPLLDENQDEPDIFETYARASDRAGDPIEAGIAYADAAYLSGRPFDAMEQLHRLLKRPHLSYYQRARVQSRITELTPLVLELKKRHVKTADRNDGYDDNLDLHGH
jgi:beta-barrel assembly-enhancing protease